MMLFMGHESAYWMELQYQATKEGKADLIKEISELRAKVSFYESRINQINEFMQLHKGV